MFKKYHNISTSDLGDNWNGKLVTTGKAQFCEEKSGLSSIGQSLAQYERLIRTGIHRGSNSHGRRSSENKRQTGSHS
jgi:hypothetical protein